MILCQFEDFPSLLVGPLPQVQTLTWDFSNLLAPELTLTGTPSLILTPIEGSDPNPASRINGAPQVGTANLTATIQGTPDCAVLAQVGPVPAGVRYICQVSCPVTPNQVGVSDVASGFNHIAGANPF